MAAKQAAGSAQNPTHSTGISLERHEALIRSPDARRERREEQLSRLPLVIGRTLRGRKREEYPVPYPTVLSKNMIDAIRRRLANNGAVVRDQFTVGIPTFTKQTEYLAYIEGALKHNKRTEIDEEEIVQAALARQRQPTDVADKLHLNTWLQWQTARLFKAGAEHARAVTGRPDDANETGLLLAASAVEDLGFTLLDHPVLGRMHGRSYIPKTMIEIGQYGAQEPKSLLIQHPQLWSVVIAEEQRREDLWGTNIHRYEDPRFGGNIRPIEDDLDQILNNELIDQLAAL